MSRTVHTQEVSAHDARSLAVQRAAVSLFARQGYSATGIRDIGREVGLNSATLYHYTQGKEELLVDIMRGCLTALLEAAHDCVSRDDASPRIKLRRLVAAHVGLSALNPLTATVTDNEVRCLSRAFRPEITGMRDEYDGLMKTVIEEGVRIDDFRVEDPPSARLAIISMCNGVASWYQPRGRMSVPEIQQVFADYAWRLVGVELRDSVRPPSDFLLIALACEPPQGRQETTQ